MNSIKQFTFVAFILMASLAFSQDIRQSEVPSTILTSFQRDYPSAYDIEWEMDGANYKVEFETGLIGKDCKIWYDKSGAIIRKKEELSQSDLPKSVLAKINEKYPSSEGYRIDDIDKITQGKEIIYRVEVKGASEWKALFDEKGTFIKQIRD